jgi:hypothetical protein
MNEEKDIFIRGIMREKWWGGEKEREGERAESRERAERERERER